MDSRSNRDNIIPKPAIGTKQTKPAVGKSTAGLCKRGTSHRSTDKAMPAPSKSKSSKSKQALKIYPPARLDANTNANEDALLVAKGPSSAPRPAPRLRRLPIKPVEDQETSPSQPAPRLRILIKIPAKDQGDDSDFEMHETSPKPQPVSAETVEPMAKEIKPDELVVDKPKQVKKVAYSKDEDGGIGTDSERSNSTDDDDDNVGDLADEVRLLGKIHINKYLTASFCYLLRFLFVFQP